MSDESTILRFRHRLDKHKLADAGCHGANKRLAANPSLHWQLAMRTGKRKKLDKANSPIDAHLDNIDKYKASIRAKVERQFGDVKVRYRGLMKITLQLKGAICAVKPLDGSTPIDGDARLSAFKSSQTALTRIKMSNCHLKLYRKTWPKDQLTYLNNLKPIARFSLSYSDLRKLRYYLVVMV